MILQAVSLPNGMCTHCTGTGHRTYDTYTYMSAYLLAGTADISQVRRDGLAVGDTASWCISTWQHDPGYGKQSSSVTSRMHLYLV